MAGIKEVPVLSYPLPYDVGTGSHIQAGDNAKIDIETPVLIVGAGPVGMIQALTLAHLHKQPCTVIEREQTTTIFPKMEYTNGRSMEIYRALGLVDELRAIGNTQVPEHYSNDEIIVTSLSKGGKLVHTWERDGPAQMRQRSKDENDGSHYREPHMRCLQTVLEKWLKEKIQAEPLITSFWATSFVSLREDKDAVVVEAKPTDKDPIRIRAQYVIGTDGAGSRVRQAVGLSSPREFLNLTVVFIHFTAPKLQEFMGFQRAWHSNVIGGGILVSQNEKDLWTCHFIMPPNMDPKDLSSDDVLGMAFGGCLGKVEVPYENILSRGTWKVDVAVAERFNSASGRVFLAGDSAHQFSPIGGHGLNTGIGDAFDLSWKLAAKLEGWGGDDLLATYDAERRQTAGEKIGHVQEALGTVMKPIFTSHEKYGPTVIQGDGGDSEKVRAELKEKAKKGYWLHNQIGNILGASYKNSPIIIEESGERPFSHNAVYTPTTFPGSRAPHVWMADGTSTIDALSKTGFSIIDFSQDGAHSQPFVDASKKLGVPLKQIRWDAELDANVRKVYERDVILIRPDGYVAWRNPTDSTTVVSAKEADDILAFVSGHGKSS